MPTELIAMLVVVNMFWAVFMSWFYLDRLIKNRGADMRRENETDFKSRMSDHIVDRLLDRQTKGELTPTEIQQHYDWLSAVLELPDLIPRSNARLKEEIKRRIASDTHKPVKLPDDSVKIRGIVRVKPLSASVNRSTHKWHTGLKSWLKRVVRKPRMTSSG